LAADCCILPYRNISQSGVHALSYAYGLPIIASDVGSFKEEDVIENETGLIFEPMNYIDLKNKILMYFNSNLYSNLQYNRSTIKEWADEKYSWEKIGEKTYQLYQSILEN